MWKWLRQLFDTSIADYLRLMATRDGAAMVMDISEVRSAAEAISEAKQRYAIPLTHEIATIEAQPNTRGTWVVRRRPGVYCVDTINGVLIERVCPHCGCKLTGVRRGDHEAKDDHVAYECHGCGKSGNIFRDGSWQTLGGKCGPK